MRFLDNTKAITLADTELADNTNVTVSGWGQISDSTLKMHLSNSNFPLLCTYFKLATLFLFFRAWSAIFALFSHKKNSVSHKNTI